MAIDKMKKALDLTRAGRLEDAVRVIQQTLTGAVRPGRAGDTIIELTPGRRAAAPLLADPTAPPPAIADVPAPSAPAASISPGRFVELYHRGTAGQLSYALYLPPDAGPGLPLIVMLHGCTQSPEDFAAGTGMNLLAEKAGIIVAYPRQTQAANPQKCWNWFRPGDQQRDEGETALIAGIVHDIQRDQQVDPARIYIAGLSAGGAAAANLAAAYPDLFAAVAIHSGLVHGAAKNVPTALSAMRQGGNTAYAAQQFVPTIVFHGERDTVVNPVNSNQIVAAATAAHDGPLSVSVEEGRRPGGRYYKRAVSQDSAGAGVIEQWTIASSGHAWSGGSAAGSYTDPAGPDASQEMLRFFLQHERSSLGVQP